VTDDRPEPPVAGDAAPAAAPRSGLDVARAALSAAKAEARRRGLRTASGPGAARADARDAAAQAAGEPTVRRRPVDTTTRSGAHPDERDPQPLAGSLDRLVADRGWETDAAVGGVMGRWAAIVGPDVAAHSEPVSFDEGELVVQAASTAWATQLRLLAPALLRRLAEEVGEGTVARLVVRGPSGPSWKKGALRVRGPGPRDTYG
jgi:predicted nucleic acid-binding Zn ribbon protein